MSLPRHKPGTLKAYPIPLLSQPSRQTETAQVSTLPTPANTPESIPPPEQISWAEFQKLFHWSQGQHVTLLGPTGYGKSTLIRLLLHLRQYVVVFATKRRDDTMDKLEKQGYKVQTHFQPEAAQRIILRPSLDPDDESKQRDEFSQTMSDVFYAGGWCMVWDEAVYLSHYLQLERKMSLLWQQGRSLGISIVAGTQRPAHLPLYAYDQPTHFFFWRMKLDRDVERIARLGGMDISGMAKTVRQLPKYHFLYYNKDTDESVITKPEVSNK